MRAEDRNITVTNRSRQESSRDLLLSTIGETPLIPLRRLDSALPAAIWAKLEMRNPAASVNDRGAALHAARVIASRANMTDKTVVVLLADTGERYITTELFERQHIS